VDDVGGFVAFAANGVWGEEGAVGFQEEFLRADLLEDVADILIFGVGGDASHAKVESHVEEFAGFGEGTGETVGDSSNGVSLLILEDSNKVGVASLAPAVEGDRELNSLGESQLGTKRLLLVGFIEGFVEVIESDFADHEDFWVSGEFFKNFFCFMGPVVGITGVGADGGVAKGVFLGEGHNGGGIVTVGGEVENKADSCFGGPLEHFGAIGVEMGMLHVGVGIGKHGKLRRDCKGGILKNMRALIQGTSAQ
jgi:hypothetical protein